MGFVLLIYNEMFLLGVPMERTALAQAIYRASHLTGEYFGAGTAR